MRVMVTFEHRFVRGTDGRIYTKGTVDYPFLSRYLSVFEDVVVLSRVEDVKPDNRETMKLADGPHVRIFPVPYYSGPKEFILKYAMIQKKIDSAADQADAFILRVAGNSGSCLWKKLVKRGVPYGVEVVADPWDALAPGTVSTKLRPFIRWKMTRDLKRQCQMAATASYVTKHTLQQRYPTQGWKTYYSTLDLPTELIRPEALLREKGHALKRKIDDGKPIRLVFVGSISVLYKAPDILIQAVKVCLDRGDKIELTIVGDGQQRSMLEKMARDLGVADRILFAGRLPAGQAVFDVLDSSDLFVLPSRTEGLPRAMIEAMARGLPCIGSTVGGFPELLDKPYLVEPGKVHTLADAISYFVNNPDEMVRAGLKNLKEAREYEYCELSRRRDEHYVKLREITENYWHKPGKKLS